MPKKNNKMAVAVCVDRNLVWQAAYVLSRSYASCQSKGVEVDHYLYLSEEVDPKFEQKFGHLFIFVQAKGDIIDAERFASRAHVSLATVLRMQAIEDLTQRYDHVLYLDADIVQRWGCPADLLQLKGFHQPLAAVADNKRWRFGKLPFNSDNHVLPEGALRKYFNAGVLFVNSAAWIDAGINETAMTALTEAEEPLPLADQTALNIAIDGNWLELSPSWNWQFSYCPDPIVAIRNPRFVHFTGGVKPWTNTRREVSEVYQASMVSFLQRFGLWDEVDAIFEKTWDKFDDEIRFTERAIKISSRAIGRVNKSKEFFARTDFADIASGIPAFGADGPQTRDKYPDLFNFPQPMEPHET